MRKLFAICFAAGALGAAASALAQSVTYSPGQRGSVGPVISANCSNGQTCKVIQPTVQAVRGSSSKLDITASTLVAAGAHSVAEVCVITAGTTAGTLNDSATTAAAATANEVYPIPNTLGCFALDWPLANGVVVVPGAGQAVSISYN